MNLALTLIVSVKLSCLVLAKFKCPITDKWFDGLNTQAAAKVTTAKVRLELGNTSSVKWFDGIGEYKIDCGPSYRIYLAKDGDTLIVLFAGGTKWGQQRDIDQAKVLHTE